MKSNIQINNTSKWVSYILQGIVALMFTMAAVNNILHTEMAVNGAKEFGYSSDSILWLGIILIISTIFYVIPKTNVLGAILLSAWLGGGVATHLIHQDPISKLMVPVLFGIVIWLSLWLRDSKFKEVFPYHL
ncbi:MAG: DoxX family protein [Saprospiraceae bacterium]